MNWCYTKMASRGIIIICILYLIIWPYLCTKYYQNWLMSVEDIAIQKQCYFWAWLIRPIFGVYDSQGSAATLVRRGGITNYHLIAYSFSNISAKIYKNRLMCVEVIVCNVSVVFLDTVYMYVYVMLKWWSCNLVTCRGQSVNLFNHLCIKHI